MQIGDTVYFLSDGKIIKSKISGTRETCWEDTGILVEYEVKLGYATVPHWVSKTTLYETEDALLDALRKKEYEEIENTLSQMKAAVVSAFSDDEQDDEA